VQVALEPPPRLVGGRDQALPGGPEVLDQRNIAQHQACLRGHVPDQPLPGRGQRLPRRAGDPQRAEALALVLDHERASPAVTRAVLRRFRSLRPGRARAS
jgi:hypothetical protein